MPWLRSLGETTDTNINWYRADGNRTCMRCNKTYREHPIENATKGFQRSGQQPIHRLCNGDLVVV
jgi:hypothetical protein